MKNLLTIFLLMGCLLGLATGSLWADGETAPIVATSATAAGSISLGSLVLIDPSIAALPDGTVLTAAQIALLPSSWSSVSKNASYSFVIKGNNRIVVTKTSSNQAKGTTSTNTYYNTYYFSNSTCPDLYASLASHPTLKTLSNAEIAMLPESWQAQINTIVNGYPDDPKFSYSFKYTNTNTVTSFNMFQGWVTTTTTVPEYTFTMSYTYSANNLNLKWFGNGSSTGFGNVTGGPPIAVYFGAPFAVNITMQAYGCENSYYELLGTTSTAFNKRSHYIDEMVRSADGVHEKDYSDSIDVWLGDFVAPQKTDQKTITTLVYKTDWFGAQYDYETITTTTTFGASPVLEVDTSLYLVDHGPNANGYRQTAELGGYWNVKLVDAPANTATISATVTPIGSYNYWIKGASKQIDVKVP